VWLALACWAEVALADPPRVQDLVDQFDRVNCLNLVSNRLYTRQGMNRAPVELGGAQHDLCRDAIFEELRRVGLNPYLDPFAYVDTTNNTTVQACNVIAVKEGVQNPNNEIYVVGSHYDSKHNPGADDNATGVACQLEMARIFAPHHFAKTIVFALFDCEERWEAGTGRHRLGSLRYVEQHTNDNIRGMISVDMIGWQAPSPNHNRASLCGRAASDALRADLQAAIATYGLGLTSVLSSADNISDHYSFAQAGFPACCLIEYAYSSNPHYHKATDYVEQPGYLDWSYLEKMCRSVIGYFATQLQPVEVAPRAVSLQPGTNGGVWVAFAGLPRCRYAIERCTNLSAPAWVALVTNAASATDGTFAIWDAAAGGQPAGFYRARFVSGYVGAGGVAPRITLQPLSRVADTAQEVRFTVAASGDAPLAYQWRRNGSAIPGATTNSYTLSSAQVTHSGDYTVVVVNHAGSVTSRVATLTVHPPQQVVFLDDFDGDSATNWVVNRSSADTRVTFGYDYSADGIPPAPHTTGGTTRGVKFEANLTQGATAAVSLSPRAQSFGGDHRLRFDLWINANGPFPTGGTGSTEYCTAGLGTAGNRVQWTGSGSTADGYWFVTTGEGGASDTSSPADYGAYAATNLQPAASGVYAAGTNATARGNGDPYYTAAFPGGQTPPAWQQANYPQQTGALAAGTVGFAWREVIVARRGNLVEWSIDGVKIATFSAVSLTASNVFVGYWDPYKSISDNAALSFGLVDNVRVEVPASAPPAPQLMPDRTVATVVGQPNTRHHFHEPARVR